MRAKPAVGNGEPRSLTTTKSDVGLSRRSRPQCSQLVALDRACARSVVLEPANVRDRAIEEPPNRRGGLKWLLQVCRRRGGFGRFFENQREPLKSSDRLS